MDSLKDLIDYNNTIKLEISALKERMVFECDLEMIERIRFSIFLLNSAVFMTNLIKEKERIYRQYHSVLLYGIESIKPSRIGDGEMPNQR